ncbi:hypothetical protein GCK72_019059 [Caenorhabditis remanei]|uniref:PAN-3 domain-containing protein n=1 Tax=Caenorhabditis remanei TaxID=31234 RepID=A0A6A5GCR0_CAERE|nr:hypothetical protein GCK72_019059 [Caenorhabditis remanei]KAF1752504.1 hypothetical protein GCK72_019059 [Caenorhabditis remanei]
MVVTWGEPLETSGSTTLDISWVDCVQKCWNDEQCVLVHDTFPTCEYYSIQQVTTVQKLPETSDSRVAFRVLYSNEATCTDAENEPALNSGTVIGSTVDDGAYNITLENDVWTFQRELKCLFPSKAFQRENIKVCMTIVQTPTCITRTEAEESCSSFGIPGTLMGIYSSDETLYLKNMSSTMLNEQKTSITYERVGIWIDGLRKSTCKSPAPNCNGYNEFDFFDPSASNPSLSWRSGQPDGLTTGAPNSDCLFMRFGEGDEFGVGDMPCTEPTFPSLNMCYSGYLCGSFPS